MPSTNRLEIHKENLRRTANAGFLQYLENNHRETTAAAWEFGRITKVDGRKLSARSSWYFAVSADVYVVFSIDTALEGGRIKAREVLHEVWVRYRGSLATLNTIDYWYVTNAAARTATTNASFVLAQTQGNVLNIWNSIAVGAPGWSELEANNPLIIGVSKLLQENAAEAGNASIANVIFFWEPKHPEANSGNMKDYELYIKIHLGHG